MDKVTEAFEIVARMAETSNERYGIGFCTERLFTHGVGKVLVDSVVERGVERAFAVAFLWEEAEWDTNDWDDVEQSLLDAWQEMLMYDMDADVDMDMMYHERMRDEMHDMI